MIRIPGPESLPQSEGGRPGLPIKSMKDIGLLIRSRRKTIGMSQQAFGDLAGVGRRFISELEAGKSTAECEKVLTVLSAAGVDLLVRLR